MIFLFTSTGKRFLAACILMIVYNMFPEKVFAVHSSHQNYTSSDAMHYDLEHKISTTDEVDVNTKKRKSDILKNLLDEENYDREIRPKGDNESDPVVVSITVHIRSIDNIDDQKMEYSVQMNFHQEWIDPRLKYAHIKTNTEYLNLAFANKIWTPDLFFLNEKSGALHQLMIPNVYTRIFRNGRVLQSYRITLTLSCVFDLRRFPMDKQSCPIRIEAYGLTSKDLLVKWNKPIPVDVISQFNYNLARFVLKNLSISESCSTFQSLETFSCVKLHLDFYRQLGFYFIQIYIPCALLVIVSWVSFWLEPTAVDARISLGVTTILTIVSLTYGINQSVPPASYIKAIDVWTSFCQAMVFGATLQFSTVNYISQSKRVKSKKLLMIAQLNALAESHTGMGSKTFSTASHDTAKRIDVISRIIFPIIFILFNMVYWTAYIF